MNATECERELWRLPRRIMAGIEPAPSLLWLLRFWALPIFRRDGD